MTRIRQAFAAHPTATTVTVVAAALLLAVVAVVLALNVLGSGDEVADASPSAPASEPPSATPEPSSGESADAPSPSVAPEVAYAEVIAVEATGDTLLRSGPGEDAEVGNLGPGDVAVVADRSQEVDGVEWYAVQHGEVFGWVSADTETLTFHRRVAQAAPASISGIDAGPSGFIAWGADAHRTDEPLEAITVVSVDGRSWQVVSAPAVGPGEVFGLTAAGGPNGWLLMGGNAEGTALGGAWRSQDGTTWEPIEVALDDGSDLTLVPTDLLGHANGYALLVRDDGSGTSRHRVLASPDGQAWRELEMPIDSGNMRIGPVGTGFAAWTEDSDGRLFVRYSPDGEAWLAPAADPADLPAGYQPMVSGAGNVMLAVTTDLASGDRTWWTTEISPAGFGAAWTPQPAAADQLAGTGIIQVLSSGDAMLALGRSFEDGSRRAWRSVDGTNWVDAGGADLLDDGNASVGLSAGSEAGFVLIGYETTDAGPNPAFIHSPDGESWSSDDGSAIPVTDSSLLGACPGAPTTMVERMAIPDVVGAECFGSTPVRFLAWSTQAGGCGGFSPGFYEPDWLASPFASGGIVLTPYEAESGGCGDGAIPPDVAELPDIQQWIEVTGQWAHSASAECQFRPDPAAVTDALWPDLAFHCRTVFVITQAVPAGLAP